MCALSRVTSVPWPKEVIIPRLFGPAMWRTPATIDELASQIDLPIGVVRILLGDLREKGLVRVVRTPGRDTQPESVLKSVLEGLRAL
jgi:DNA-binding transcriptional ArsR family regulator